MKKNKQAISLVEAVVVVMIISLGLVGIIKLYTKSIEFLDGVGAKIQATQIAREGIEAVENIRDTNWLLFSSDTTNCWNVVNYDAKCIGGENVSSIETMNGTYKIYRDQNNRWLLAKPVTNSGSGFFDVGLDNNNFYTQTGTFIENKYMKGKRFRREITITPGIDLQNVNGDETDSGSGVTVISKVEWMDSTRTKRRKVEIENILTNYK